MREQMLTPLDLWNDYSAESERLQVNIVRQTTEKKRRIRWAYISGAAESVDIRIAVKVVYPVGEDPCPCMLYITDFSQKMNDKIVDQMTKNGIAVVTFEYMGRDNEDSHFTRYGTAFSFASAPKCYDALESAYPSVRQSPWYVWSGLARRVLWYIDSDPRLSDRIMLYGENEGSMMAWHVAAFDRSVTCMATVGGFYPRSIAEIENKAPLVPDNLRWVAGLMSEAYAKYVTCPVITFFATNSSSEALEKYDKVWVSLPAGIEKYACYTPMSEHELSEQSFNSLLQFAYKYLKSSTAVEFPLNLELECESGDGYKRFVLRTGDIKYASVQLYYSFGDCPSAYRSWIGVPMKREKNEYSVSLPTDNMTDRLLVFANVTRGGCIFSTPLEYYSLPHNDEIRNVNRILYEGRRGGTGVFTSATGELFWADYDCRVTAGALDINGITAESGYLQSFVLQDASYKPGDDSILLFDIYSEHDADITVTLYAYKDGIQSHYVAKSSVKAAPMWQKISLPTDSFKQDEYVTLRNWNAIYKIVFSGVDKMVINNVLWL